MFPKPTFEDWKKKVIADLKGKDFGKSLVWRSPEGLEIQPLYYDTPIEESQSFVLPAKGWEIVEPIEVLDAENANATAIKALQGGATAIFFDLKGKDVDPDILCRDILLDVARVYLRDAPANAGWQTFIRKNDQTLLTPLTDLLVGINKGEQSDFKSFSFEGGKTSLLVDAAIIKECGGSIIHEIGYGISALQEQLHVATSSVGGQSGIKEIIILTSVGNHYFFEIAKIRALRRLADLVIAEYGDIPFGILAVSSDIHISQTDTHTNILRLTTAAMSAALGKADSILLRPYDDSEVTRRISRNIHHLMMEESHFHRYSDPAAGSHYISHLTKEMKEAAWQLFLETESEGGYITAMDKGIIRQHIGEHRQLLQREIATRKSILLGVNQFPNLTDPPKNGVHEDTEASDKGLQPIRLAEPFERLRLLTEHHVAKGHRRPTAYLLKFGDLSISNARATWSLNFLSCAGIASIESSHPSDWEASMRELKSTQTDLVVFCSDNNSWDTLLPEILLKISTSHLKILAGRGDVPGMDISIHEGCNLLEILEDILLRLGIGK